MSNASEVGYGLKADLTGNTAFPEARSVSLFIVCDWAPDDIRLECAEFYGVPLKQVAWPYRTTRDQWERDELDAD